jgi:hypothetical protein
MRYDNLVQRRNGSERMLRIRIMALLRTCQRSRWERFVTHYTKEDVPNIVGSADDLHGRHA